MERIGFESENLKTEWNNAICNNMDGPGDYHTKWSQQTEKDKNHMRSLTCRFKKKKKDTNELIYKTEIDPQT